MLQLVEQTLLKQNVLQNIVPAIINEVKSELIADFKSALKSVVIETVEEVVTPLRQLINNQQNKIESLEQENKNMKQHFEKSISDVEHRYEKFRNIANANATYLSENAQLKKEIASLNCKIEELEQ